MVVVNLLNMQLLDEKDRSRILGPYQKVREWVENTKNAANPHFDEVHKLLFKLKATLQKQRSEKLTSKMWSFGCLSNYCNGISAINKKRCEDELQCK